MRSKVSNENQVVMKLENNILHKENLQMKEAIQSLTNKENKILEIYEVEKMIVEALQKYLKSIELDYGEVVKEYDTKIRQLKDKIHKLKITAHYKQKEIQIKKEASKLLKQNLDVERKDRAELNKKIKDLNRKLKMTEEECAVLNSRKQELEAMVKSTDYLKDEIDFHKEKHRTKENEIHNLQ